MTLAEPDDRWYERLSESAPSDPEAWWEVADELVASGRDADAVRALRKYLDLAPDDVRALADLAHLEHRAGRSGEAIELLSKALERSPRNAALLRGLVDLHLMRGQTESALARAEELAEVDREDVTVLLDIAEIALQMGDRAKAVRTFSRLGERDDADGHKVFALHGIIAAEIADSRWRAAMNAAIDATAADRHELTTDLLVFVTAQLFGADPQRPPKPWEELSGKLSAARAAHRRFHVEQAFW